MKAWGAMRSMTPRGIGVPSFECVAVASDVEDDLVGGGVFGGEEPCECVRSLCRE